MKTLVLAAGLAACAIGLASPASAETGRADAQFIGIDLDNGSIYYNGRNSGRYCLYQTVRVFNRVTGYYERRRARRCGRGLYFR
ncbi:hypothetical protein [Chenggangzhangella methanolivorans]|uniref:Uncharacterized protein n=1 Tax=Chenggangzhangella methanolivorans TaxID=1437009 RepID=A0A9E6R5S0_9HYPH|nr:hypothetical protein [Chenggangzhangella methanolivorans]QZN98702.1 hypothetical protein K6K41_17070 [Chenggangzhangella methanolivorans]